LFPNQGWTVEQSASLSESTEIVVQSATGDRWMIRYAYISGRARTGSAAVSKAAYAFQQLWADPAAGVVAVAMRCRDRCAEETAILGTRWAQIAPSLQRQIEDAGA
jgi:hypothetical protein